MRLRTDVLFLTSVTIAEIELGIAMAAGKGASRKAHRLAEWLEEVIDDFAGHILTFDISAARHVGAMAERARVAGQQPGFPDLAIAAIAHHHRFTVATRNTRHFAPMGIQVLDPFAAPPGT